MTDKIIVLYIDDEDNNLNSFRASLRREFKVVTALNAEEGLRVAATQEIHVVIADQRMPGMTGVEFFEKLMKINPDPIRILLTGYSDIASVIDAINKGEVYRFIDKPWNIDQVKIAIKNAAEIYFTRKELKDKNERLLKIQSEMNQFVYSLSHELRGPLMSISSVSKLAKLESKAPSVIEYFDMIDSSTDKLDDYIFKMMDFYRATKIENKILEVSFNEIVSEQLGIYGNKWNLQDVDVIVNINQSAPFFTDDSKLKVILNHLFSNAYNYQKENNPNKAIWVSVESDENSAIIVFEDNGIGIEQAFLGDVFNLFQRATQKSTGSGLGLYMVKESVTQLGGKIAIDSIVNEGTKITIRLPSLAVKANEKQATD
jgi:two-component system sensor histidine kinase/response regulator